MAKVGLPPSELERQLREQVGFLENSADAYDKGNRGEAKRLAVALRILLHEGRTSKPLLLQLDRLPQRFLSTAMRRDFDSVMTYAGLTMVAVRSSNPEHIALLDTEMPARWLPFTDWWHEVVIVDDRRNELSRASLVRTACDQDGGAHVDPSIDEVYYRLTRDNSIGWVHEQGPDTRPIPGVAAASIRQVAHELLRSLDPAYRKKTTEKADYFFGGTALVRTTGAPSPPGPQRAIIEHVRQQPQRPPPRSRRKR